MFYYVSFTFLGFATLLQTYFPNYEIKVLQKISGYFIHTRVKHMNFLIKEAKRIKNEAKAKNTNSLRHDIKIAQYKAD